MKAKTAMGGCQNGVYSKAYAFFEKKRIWEGLGKTDARRKCEEENPMGLAIQDESIASTVTKPIGNRGTGRKQKLPLTMTLSV